MLSQNPQANKTKVRRNIQAYWNMDFFFFGGGGGWVRHSISI